MENRPPTKTTSFRRRREFLTEDDGDTDIRPVAASLPRRESKMIGVDSSGQNPKATQLEIRLDEISRQAQKETLDHLSSGNRGKLRDTAAYGPPPFVPLSEAETSKMAAEKKGGLHFEKKVTPTFSPLSDPSCQEFDAVDVASMAENAAQIKTEKLRVALLQIFICYAPHKLITIPEVLDRFEKDQQDIISDLQRVFSQLPVHGETNRVLKVDYRARLFVYVCFTCPEKLDDVDQLLKSHRFREHQLLAALVDKFGVERRAAELYESWKDVLRNDAKKVEKKYRKDQRKKNLSSVEAPKPPIIQADDGKLYKCVVRGFSEYLPGFDPSSSDWMNEMQPPTQKYYDPVLDRSFHIHTQPSFAEFSPLKNSSRASSSLWNEDEPLGEMAQSVVLDNNSSFTSDNRTPLSSRVANRSAVPKRTSVVVAPLDVPMPNALIASGRSISVDEELTRDEYSNIFSKMLNVDLAALHPSQVSPASEELQNDSILSNLLLPPPVVHLEKVNTSLLPPITPDQRLRASISQTRSTPSTDGIVFPNNPASSREKVTLSLIPASPRSAAARRVSFAGARSVPRWGSGDDNPPLQQDGREPQMYQSVLERDFLLL